MFSTSLFLQLTLLNLTSAHALTPSTDRSAEISELNVRLGDRFLFGSELEFQVPSMRILLPYFDVARHFRRYPALIENFPLQLKAVWKRTRKAKCESWLRGESDSSPFDRSQDDLARYLLQTRLAPLSELRLKSNLPEDIRAVFAPFAWKNEGETRIEFYHRVAIHSVSDYVTHLRSFLGLVSKRRPVLGREPADTESPHSYQ